MTEQETPRQLSPTFQPEGTITAVVNPTSIPASSSSRDNLLGGSYYVDKMIDNFAYAPFTLGPINPINMEEAGVALRQAGLRQRVGENIFVLHAHLHMCVRNAHASVCVCVCV